MKQHIIFSGCGQAFDKVKLYSVCIEGDDEDVEEALACINKAGLDPHAARRWDAKPEDACSHCDEEA